MNQASTVRDALLEAANTLDAFLEDPKNLDAVATFARETTNALDRGGLIMSCGNGGSLCDAMHFAEELTGRFRTRRRPLAALAFSDPTQMSAIGNDFGFESVFARQVEAHGHPGDLLVVLSTSGESENIVHAVVEARRRGIRTVGLLGRGGGKVRDLVDLPILVPRAKHADRIQEVHIKILHIVLEVVESQLLPEISASPDSESD